MYRFGAASSTPARELRRDGAAGAPRAAGVRPPRVPGRAPGPGGAQGRAARRRVGPRLPLRGQPDHPGEGDAPGGRRRRHAAAGDPQRPRPGLPVRRRRRRSPGRRAARRADADGWSAGTPSWPRSSTSSNGRRWSRSPVPVASGSRRSPGRSPPRPGPARPDGSWIVDLASLGAGAAVLPAVAGRLDLVVDDRRGGRRRSRDRPARRAPRARQLRARGRRGGRARRAGCWPSPDGTRPDPRHQPGAPRARVPRPSSPSAPLDVDAARELFSARARAGRPAWDPDDSATTASTARRRARPAAPDDRDGRRPPRVDDARRARGRDRSTGTSLLQMPHRAPARRHRSLESVVDWSADAARPRRAQACSTGSRCSPGR